MSGHSKWSQIKRQKGAADQKKGQLFGKISKLISMAAKSDPNPSTNLRLATVIEQARAVNMPKDNIDRAIKRSADKDASILTEITVQALAPGGVGLIITAVTDNKNRTISEIKNILAKHESKMADEGSLSWQFEKKIGPQGIIWEAKYPAEVDAASRVALEQLFGKLDQNDDVDEIYSSLKT